MRSGGEVLGFTESLKPEIVEVQRDDWLGSSVPQRAAGVEPAHDCPTGATMMEHDTRLRVALRFLILAGVGVGMWALR